jgi:hypothetical protein
MPDEVTPRRFPPPWTVEDNGACFIVKDRADLGLEISSFHPSWLWPPLSFCVREPEGA